MAHHPTPSFDPDQRYDFTGKAQSRLIMYMIAGLIAIVIGCVLMANGVGAAHHEAKHEVANVKAADGYGLDHITDLGAASADHKSDAGHQAAEGGHEAVSAAPHGGTNAVPSQGHDVAASTAHQSQQAHAAAAEADHGKGHHEAGWWQRVLANFWLDGVFFTGLSVIGLFFVAIQYVSQAGWSAGIKRVMMAFGSWLPFSLVILLVTFIVGQHDLFHWTHSELTTEGSPEYDEILANKSGYLNVPFFLVRMVVFVGLWILFQTLIRKNSLREDIEGGDSFWHKNHGLSAAFLVIFGVSSSMMAWDWVMSVEPHWYSTLFGWYMFASWFVSGLSTMAITIVMLKEKGYLQNVSMNHIHDMGKFMFAFSIFWAYLWIAQYLLIWYANIPEEGIYFIERLYGFDSTFRASFFLNIFINFAFPFLVLMTRDAKRAPIFIKVVGFGILGGHWLDFYLMIMPGTLGASSGFGLIEFGTLAIFVSAFILVISRSLASAPLVAKHHPMLGESLVHDI